uniref:Uncharacterized protein n=1 Tax=Oryza sativa subsp. japonica TaxID=39947 RepID=Q75KW1_ORYSJ|nr:hypothetical protein [Oryza sativa Japonica Group]
MARSRRARDPAAESPALAAETDLVVPVAGRKARIGCGGLRVRPMCAADLQLEDVRNIAGFVRSSILESVFEKHGKKTRKLFFESGKV